MHKLPEPLYQRINRDQVVAVVHGIATMMGEHGLVGDDDYQVTGNR
jgi:hypothetical protein